MTKEKVIAFRNAFRKEHLPHHYSPWLHVFFNGGVLLSIFVYLVLQLNEVEAIELLMIPLLLILSNLFVHLFHRYPLHHPYRISKKYTYRIHTRMHHYFFTDQIITYKTPADFYIIFFPPLSVVFFGGIYLPIAYFILPFFFSMNAVWLWMITSTFYFLAYETVHYISHVEDGHPILRIGYFNMMRNHHRVHHNPRLMQTQNFNIVFPLFDYVFGTYNSDYSTFSTAASSTSDLDLS